MDAITSSAAVVLFALSSRRAAGLSPSSRAITVGETHKRGTGLAPMMKIPYADKVFLVDPDYPSAGRIGRLVEHALGNDSSRRRQESEPVHARARCGFCTKLWFRRNG